MKVQNKKKAMLSIVAVALVCVVTILGTLAYLTKSTPEVSNTFVAAGGGELIPNETPDPANPISGKGFFLYEHTATKNAATGAYTLATGTAKADLTQSQSYDVLPGVDIPKDPFITMKGLNAGMQAYVFVEVKSGLGAALTYAMDSKWTKLTGVTGKNGGDIYSYTNASVSTDIASASILANNKITVSGTGDATALAGNIKFYGYLCQASGFSTPADAYAACFK